MHAFQALGIKEAAGIADNEATIDIVARHRVPAAIGQRLCAVADQLAAFEDAADEGMRFPGLKSGMGIEA